MNTCKNCVYFIRQRKHEEYEFIIGCCKNEPFDMRNMMSYNMTVACGYDGCIIVGEDFGCIHFQQK